MKMFEQVLKSIQQFGNFSEEELGMVSGKLKEKKLEKNAFLIQQGQICDAIYFLNQGSLRHYLITNNNEQLILNLITEHNWVLDYQSFISQKPSENFIQAFEKSVVFELNVYSLHELIGHSQSFLKIAKLLESGLQNIYLQGNLISPEDKYRDILTKKPQLIQKFPLKYIASYLRMTPETLSRVRAKINPGC